MGRSFGCIEQAVSRIVHQAGCDAGGRVNPLQGLDRVRRKFRDIVDVAAVVIESKVKPGVVPDRITEPYAPAQTVFFIVILSSY